MTIVGILLVCVAIILGVWAVGSVIAYWMFTNWNRVNHIQRDKATVRRQAMLWWWLLLKRRNV